MRIPTAILDKVKPILLEQGDLVHCRFSSNNGEIYMTTVTKKGNIQNDTIATYDNLEKSCKLARSLNRVYRF